MRRANGDVFAAKVCGCVVVFLGRVLLYSTSWDLLLRVAIGVVHGLLAKQRVLTRSTSLTVEGLVQKNHSSLMRMESG